MRRLLCGALIVSGMLYTLGARADDAKTIIEKGIAAAGGADKLGKTKTLTWKGKGTVNIMGNTIEFSGDWFIQPPKQMKNQIDIDFGGNKTTITTVLNGDKGWRSFMGQTMDLDDDSLAEAKEELYAGSVGQLVPLIGDSGFKLTALGDSKVGDQAVAGVDRKSTRLNSSH